MGEISGLTVALHGNEALFVVVLGLAGLDLLLGVGRALAQKRFQSGLLRNSLSKLIQEMGLPLLLGILGVAYPGFGVLVPAALWVAVASEGTSIVEQLKGKLPNTLLTEILTLLKGSSAPSQTSVTPPTSLTKGG